MGKKTKNFFWFLFGAAYMLASFFFVEWTQHTYSIYSGSQHAEIWENGAWHPAEDMLSPRAWHSATLLDDGRVLVAGGYARRLCRLFGALYCHEQIEPPDQTAEIYKAKR